MHILKKSANKYIVRQLRRRVMTLLQTRQLTVVMVTGTVGKTSTKLAIGQTLVQLGRKVCFSEDSYNTEIGLPLAIFGLKAPDNLKSPAAWRRLFRDVDEQLAQYPYDTLVLEIAEDERVMMAPWVELLKPSLAVLTSVSPAHMARFESLDQLRDDAVWLATRAERVFYNADSELVCKVMERKKGARGYGLKQGEIRFTNLTRNRSGALSAELKLGRRQVLVRTQLIAPHALTSLLAAASIAVELDYPLEKIARALQSVSPVKGRMRLLPAVNKARLIDDTYNSSPAAVEAALDTLMDLPGRRKIAVLGSMNELGSHSSALHRQVAKYAESKKIDLLVTVGREAANYLVPAAIEAGMDKAMVKQFRTPYEAGHYLKKIIQANDIVLVKGSQNGVFTEETSRILLSPSLHPSKELVRQSKAWKRIKKKSFGI